MTDYYMLSSRIWVIGQDIDPKLYYYADADKTIEIKLFDANGYAVLDNNSQEVKMNVGVVQGANEISLGDWLSAVNKTWSEGIYLLRINNGEYNMLAPLIIVSGSMTIPVEETDLIEKIIVVDNITSVFVELPPTTSTIPASNRFRTFIYQHNDKLKLGRLVSINGIETEFDTKWIKNAIIQLEIKFNNLNDMASFLSKLGYVRNPHKDVVEAIGKLINNDPSKVVSILSLYGVIPVLNSRMLSYEIDPDNYIIRYKLLVRLGWGWDDLVEAAKWGLAIGVAAGSVAAAVGITTGTFGLGTAVGIGVAAAGITFAYKLLAGNQSESGEGAGVRLGSDVSDLVDHINIIYHIGRKKIEDQYKKTINDLDQLYQAGEITQHAYEILKADIDELYSTSIAALDELYQESVKAIKEAYKRGQQSMYIWTAVAGLGGAGIGYALGRRGK